MDRQEPATDNDSKNLNTEENPVKQARKHQFKIFDLVGEGFDETPELKPDPESSDDPNPPEKPGGEPGNEKPEDKDEPPPPEKEDEPEKTPAAPKVTVRKKEKPLPDIPPFTPEKPADPAPAPPSQKRDDPAPLSEPADLTDDEREELELARFADKDKPGAYKASLDFIYKRREFIKQRMADEGRGYRPSLDIEYREWLEENAPMKPSQRKQLERRKLQEELRQEIEQGNRKREEELRREIEALKLKPEIEKKIGTFRSEIETELPATLKEVFPEVEDTEGAVAEIRPLLEPVTEQYSKLVETFLGLNAGAESYDPRNPSHNYINRFISEQAKYFEAHGGASLFRDGRRFVRPDMWPQVPEDKRHLYWTFSEKDIVEVFAEKSRMETRRILEGERKKWEKFQKLAPRKKADDPNPKPSGKQPDASQPSNNPKPDDFGPSAETSTSPGASEGEELDEQPPSFIALLNR